MPAERYLCMHAVMKVVTADPIRGVRHFNVASTALVCPLLRNSSPRNTTEGWTVLLGITWGTPQCGSWRSSRTMDLHPECKAPHRLQHSQSWNTHSNNARTRTMCLLEHYRPPSHELLHVHGHRNCYRGHWTNCSREWKVYKRHTCQLQCIADLFRSYSRHFCRLPGHWQC